LRGVFLRRLLNAVIPLGDAELLIRFLARQHGVDLQNLLYHLVWSVSVNFCVDDPVEIFFTLIGTSRPTLSGPEQLRVPIDIVVP